MHDCNLGTVEPQGSELRPIDCRYPSQGNIMRYRALGRLCEYLGPPRRRPNFVGPPLGTPTAILPSFVAVRAGLEFRLANQAPGCTEKSGPGKGEKRLSGTSSHVGVVGALLML